MRGGEGIDRGESGHSSYRTVGRKADRNVERVVSRHRKDRLEAECSGAGAGSVKMMDFTYTILVADDNEFVVRTMRRHLEEDGFEVVPACDGKEALRLALEVPIDLVLLDVNMPGLDGTEVLRTLRQRFTPEQLPVIMATANGQSRDVVQAFDLGANDYVTKPLDFPVVLARIHRELRSRVPARERQDAGPALFSDIAIGNILEGRYRLDARIGKGQFGVVYRATHLTLQRSVAVKVLQAPLEDEGTTIERFKREGVSTCRIQHPNAVTVLDFSVTAGGVPFLVMELLEGRTLEEELEERGRFDPQHCGDIVLPLCEVLHEAHSLGIIHRDIKPQNIFLHQTRLGEAVKVLDFGIAKLVGEVLISQNATLEGNNPGTPAYMAPERYSEIPYDGRADVYSLGVVLYEMLVGRPPFTVSDGNAMKLALMHLSEKPKPPRELRPELSPALEAVVLSALGKDSEERPTVERLAHALARALDREPPSFERVATDDELSTRAPDANEAA